MTRKIITLTAAASLSLAGLVYLQANEPGEHGPKHDGPGPHQIPGIRGNCDNNCIIAPMTADDLVRDWAI